MTRPLRFYAGFFLLTFSILTIEIAQTRILSVVAWYHLAFFVVSAAMFGMTAGAVWVYLRGHRYTRETLSADLCRFTTASAILTCLSLCVQMTLVTDMVFSVSAIVAIAQMTVVVATPFFFSGIVVCLALTRSPFPIARVYAVDLLGAGAGCLGALVLLNLTDAPSAILLSSGCIALAALLFRASGIGGLAARPGGPAILHRPGWICIFLIGVGILNSVSPYRLRPMLVKDAIEKSVGIPPDFMEWNSFSRIRARAPTVSVPDLWGPSPRLPADIKTEGIFLDIDGVAGTYMYRFRGDVSEVNFLKYDLTNLAYSIRNSGRSAVIGVGSGRDLLSAWTFGFRDITGVEINPIFIKLLTRSPMHRDFAGLSALNGVKFHVDEARSWFARTQERFDLIQMSMIDTFAASSAGAFTLTENGLYTVEGWKVFLSRLSDHGIYTVSRWYGKGDVNETGRMMSLASAVLMELGVQEPQKHMFVAAADHIATLVLSRSPLSAEEIGTLARTCDQMGYRILLSPDAPPDSDVLKKILGSQSREDLDRYTSSLPLDLTPPTDDRPFFFNILPLRRLHQALSYGDHTKSGIIRGNLIATATLGAILAVSTILVLLTIVIPLRSSIRQIGTRLAVGGTLYFLLLGIGFMLVEIGLLQRLSVFLGHPIYSLSVVLFSIIIATGIGSFLSGRVPILAPGRFLIWALVLGAYLIVLPLWLPDVTARFDGSSTPIRALIAVLTILPAGVLMGFGFPTGMSLVQNINEKPTPWFWGVNGAGGVFASVVAVAVSIAYGINITIILGGLCYLALIPSALLVGFVSTPPSKGLATSRGV